MTELTPKQQRFVDAWDGNNTDAARQAGYKGNDKTLEAMGRQNFAKPRIRAAIKAREETRQSKTIATREERQAFFSRVLRGLETQTVIVGKGDDAQAVELPPAMKDRLKAAELLGKSEGDFIERKEISGPNGGPIETRQDVIKQLIETVDGNTRGIPVPRDPGAEDGDDE